MIFIELVNFYPQKMIFELVKMDTRPCSNHSKYEITGLSKKLMHDKMELVMGSKFC